MAGRSIQLQGIPKIDPRLQVCAECQSRICIHAAPGPRNRVLTPRECSVLRLLGNGIKDKEIALFLGLSYRTVKVYNSRIFTKIGVTSRYEAGLWARDNGALLGVSPATLGRSA